MNSKRTIYFQRKEIFKKFNDITIIGEGGLSSAKCLVSDIPVSDYLVQNYSIGNLLDLDSSLVLKVSLMCHIIKVLPGSLFAYSLQTGDGHPTLTI
jgi:hypothetical protein